MVDADRIYPQDAGIGLAPKVAKRCFQVQGDRKVLTVESHARPDIGRLPFAPSVGEGLELWLFAQRHDIEMATYWVVPLARLQADESGFAEVMAQWEKRVDGVMLRRARSLHVLSEEEGQERQGEDPRQ